MIWPPPFLSSVPTSNARKRLIKAKVKQHYDASRTEVVTAEATRILLSSESRFDGAATELQGIIHRFPQSLIPVFIHSADQKNQAIARSAMESLNTVFRDGTDTLLVEQPSTPGRQIGRASGIHIYFGSNKCMWRVFEEQTNREKRYFSPRIQASFDRQRSMTVRQSLRANGETSGKLHVAYSIIFNIEDPLIKQYVVEYALMRALGVKGRAQMVLWSRMAPITELRAPSDTLTDFDRNLLRILYGKLEPGNTGTETAIRMSKHWQKTDTQSTGTPDKCVADATRRQANGDNIRNLDLLNRLLWVC